MYKLLFRCGSVILIDFFLLCILPFPLDRLVPGVSKAYYGLTAHCVKWVAVHILDVSIKSGPNGSGDTTFNYVQLLLNIALALFLGIGWFLLSGQKQDAWVRKWFGVLLRYYVAVNMLSYGIYKVFHLQMPSPFLYQLVQPLGEKSPMGLAWTFIGLSKGYSMFVGLAEVLAGVLLLFARTKTLGALLTMVVMINVAAMNIAFDIPVKIFSVTLVAMSLYIAWDDLGRLCSVLLWNRPTTPSVKPELFGSKRSKTVGIVVKVLLIGYLFSTFLIGALEGRRQYGDQRRKPVLRGIYDNELLIVNGDTIPRVKPRNSHWKQLIIDFPDFAHVKGTDDSLSRIPLKTDIERNQLVIGRSAYGNTETRLDYHMNGDTLTIKGVVYADSVFMRFKKQELSRYPLISTDFRWINEYPYNR